MGKHLLLLAIGLIAGLLALGAVACDDDDEDGGDETPAVTQPADGAATEPAGEATEPADGEEPAAEIAPVSMEEMDGSGVTGSATITETETGGTEVVVTIDGGLEEGAHMNHLHHGTCAAQGEVHVPLEELTAGADGSATMTTTIDDPPFSHWLESEHYVAVHALDGSVVSCGDVLAAS